MKSSLAELALVLAAIVAPAFVGSIKGQIGSNEAERTAKGAAVGAMVIGAYKIFKDKNSNLRAER